MRSLIVNGFYTTNPLTVHLIVRNRNGKETLSFKPEKPYLYVEGDGDRISLYGIQLKRVEVDIPSDVIRAYLYFKFHISHFVLCNILLWSTVNYKRLYTPTVLSYMKTCSLGE